MQIVNSLEEISNNGLPVILTIGSFDGVHLGHQALLEQVVQTAKNEKAQSVVLTFSNHPSQVLRPDHITPLLCAIDHKMLLLEKASIDLVILLPFSKTLSEQSANFFLTTIRKFLTFKKLILGSDAHIGKNREGDQAAVTSLSTSFGFDIEYFSDVTIEGKRISSRLIRENVQKGEFESAKALLGRTYSIYGSILKGNGRGASLGFPTANLNVNTLCLPPLGVYSVTLVTEGQAFPGVANLGLAPTVRFESSPLLEVHLFNVSLDLYGKKADVFFHRFIREEMKFENIDTLKKQIAIDVSIGRQMHEGCGR